MDEVLLRAFVTVAEELHFGRAAEQLHVSQSALSRQIARLERQVDAELFARGPRGITLTPAGQRLLERGRPLLAQLEDLVTDVARLGGSVDVVRFGSPPYARYLPATQAWRAALRARRPDVELEVVYGLSGDLSARLEREELDAAILLVTRDEPDLVVVDLLRPRLSLVLPLGHPRAGDDVVDLDALRDETLVLWPRETNPKLYDAILALFPPGALHETSHLAASWDVIMSAVASGAGISVMMPDLWNPEVVEVVVRPIHGRSRLGRLVVAVRRDERRPHVVALLEGAEVSRPDGGPMDRSGA